MNREGGSALLVVLLATLLLSAIGLAIVMSAIGNALASGNASSSRAMLYAADAGIERALPDLRRIPDWDLVLSGAAASAFADGPPSGSRQLPGGGTVVLEEVVNLANCGRREACDEAELSTPTEERPWGPDNPRWRLFAWGPFSPFADGGDAAYLVVMVADDPLDGDSDPSRDGRGASPGRGVLLLRAEAHGAGGASRALEAAVARTDVAPGPEGYLGQRGGSGHTSGESMAGVQAGGEGLARSEVAVNGGEAPR